MKRTQIYLPESLYQELSWQSRRKNVSISELIRERITFKTVSPAGNCHEIFRDLGKEGEKLSWKGVPKDLSRKIDEVVYG
jgi:hypothetical protein